MPLLVPHVCCPSTSPGPVLNVCACPVYLLLPQDEAAEQLTAAAAKRKTPAQQAAKAPAGLMQTLLSRPAGAAASTKHHRPKRGRKAQHQQPQVGA